MKKKSWLLSFLLITATAILAISATTAYFTAQKTGTANKFTIGTLDLDISSESGKLEPINIAALGSQANIQGEKTWTVKNTGTLPGRLLVKLANVKNLENGCNSPEKEAEENCETDNLGELGKIINVKVLLDDSQKAQSTLAQDQIKEIESQWNNLAPVILNPGESKTLSLSWSANETDYGNEVQSDSAEFDLDFRLIQKN